jgi:hypothetical protein
MSDEKSELSPSRRNVLKTASVGATSMALMHSATAHDGHEEGKGDKDHYRQREDDWEKGTTCGYSNPQGGLGFLFPAHHDICAPDHPESLRLKDACGYTLDHLYPDIGTIIAQGAIPYFDILSVGGFSHWLFPGHINNYNHSLDPGRPETVLVNNDNYCPQGIMFIPPHTQKGQESPLYVTGEPESYDHEYAYGKMRRKHDDATKFFVKNGDLTGEDEYRNSETQGLWDQYERTDFDVEEWQHEGTICAPWHYHSDAFARFAWWYNRQFHQNALVENQEAEFWCHVPGMFHVWPGAEDGSIATFEHDAPNEYRNGPEPCRSGYPTPATPQDADEPLTLEDMPEWLQEKAMPADLERELRILSDFDDETIYQMSIGEIMDLVEYQPNLL